MNIVDPRESFGRIRRALLIRPGELGVAHCLNFGRRPHLQVDACMRPGDASERRLVNEPRAGREKKRTMRLKRLRIFLLAIVAAVVVPVGFALSLDSEPQVTYATDRPAACI